MTEKSSRPFSVTLLTLGVLTIATINLIRFLLSLLQWEFLNDILPISPAYLAVSGLVWCLVLLTQTWGLWRGHTWAPRLTLVTSLTYTLYYWLDRIFLTANYGGQNWPFALVFNITLLASIYWILSRRKARAFFGELYE
jgi:hypothetical protein